MQFDQLRKQKRNILYSITIVCFFASIIFVQTNHHFYDRTIAKVIDTKVEEITEVTDHHQNKDKLFRQLITAKVKNGTEKDSIITLTNEYSTSGAYDHAFRKGNELFIKIQDNSPGDELYGSILSVKRDKYIVLVAWLFIFTLLLVGKNQGLRAIISLVVNILLLSFALDIYVQTTDTSLLWICGFMAIIFTLSSLFFVNGFNEKTYAAIITTLIGTFSALLISFLAIKFTGGKGLHYEEMNFLTRPYQLVFMAGLFIGSLGAVMDVAITMSSALFSMYEQQPQISTDALKKSGKEIGENILGTITNILLFVYLSGSIPVLILFLKNGSPLSFSLSMTLSLEIARALAGGIGVVLSIPISLYTSIYFIQRKKAKA